MTDGSLGRTTDYKPALALHISAEKSFNEINLKSLSETNLDQARVVKQTRTAKAKEQRGVRGNFKSLLRVVHRI